MAGQSFCLIFLLCFSLTLGTNVHEQCQSGIENCFANAQKAAKASDEFSWKLFSKVSKPDENLIYSPVSISLALALVQSGTSGATLTELQQHLAPTSSYPCAHPTHLYESLCYGLNLVEFLSCQPNTLQRQLQINGQLQVEGQHYKLGLNIANGLFYSQDLTVKPEFINRTKQCFEQVEKVQFKTNSEEARRHVNQWVSEKTAQKIPELFKPRTIDAQTVAVLANALYLNASWAKSFQTNQNLPFYKLGGGQAQTVPFMTQELRTSYAENDKMQLVEIRFDGALSLFVSLPKQRDGFRSITSANKEEIRSLHTSMTERKVNLKIPKFTVRTSINLKDVLEQIGINKVFSDQADFSKLSDQRLKVSSAVHEAYIKVNENGTDDEAYASTGLGITMNSMPRPEPSVEFTADHPFSFAIVHKPTKAAIFVGKVVKIDQE